MTIKQYQTKYAEIKARLHVCKAEEYEGLKQLMNYYYCKGFRSGSVDTWLLIIKLTVLVTFALW